MQLSADRMEQLLPRPKRRQIMTCAMVLLSAGIRIAGVATLLLSCSNV